MKHLGLIFASILIISACNSSSVKNNKTEISINAIEVDETLSGKVEYSIDECSYPEINGLDDIDFQNTLNDIFRNNLYSFLEYDLDSGIEDHSIQEPEDAEMTNDEEDIYISPGTIRSSFDILTNDGSILSIVQYFVVEGVGGGNIWEPFSTVTNIDLENKMILNPIDLGLRSKDSSLINKQIKAFFDAEFPYNNYSDDELNMPYPKITNIEDIGVGISDDSLVLVLEAWPAAHSSHGTYFISIDKWQKKQN